MGFPKIFAAIFFSFLIIIFCEKSDDFYVKWIEEYRKVSGKTSPPTKFKEWINIAKDLKCSTNPSDYKQIFSDINNFKNVNISVEFLKSYEQKIKQLGRNIDGYNTHKLSNSLFWPISNSWFYVPRVIDPSVDFYALIQIFDESMSFPADINPEKPYEDMADVLNRCKSLRQSLDMYADKFIHLQAPTSFLPVPYKVPIFSKNRLIGGSDIILPTYQTGLLTYLSSIKIALSSPKWEDKLQSAVFRGRPTGINFDKAKKENIPLTNNPRFKLHEMSLKQARGQLNCSVKLDFGVNSISDCLKDENYLNEVRKQFPEVNHMDFESQFKSKYLVVVDGHGCPDRISLYMLSGSLVFFATVHEDWTINQIVEGVHYIKVKPDLSDLIEKLEWAAANDNEARAIAANGSKFVSQTMGVSQVQVYNAFLFMEYQTLFYK